MTGIPVAISLCSLDNTLIIDPTAEEEEKAESRYGFGWVFGMGYGDVKEGEDVKMEMDGEGDDGVGSELVWVGCEGDFTRQQVGIRPFLSYFCDIIFDNLSDPFL